MINEEIANIVYDYIKRGIGCDYDIFNSPPPPIPIRPVKIKTLKERLEETKMVPTSVWKIEGIDKIWITQDVDEMSFLVKNKDDLTKIILIGDAIKNHNDKFITTLKADLEENEKEFRKQEKKIKELESEKNREINKLHQQLHQAEHDKRSLTWKNEQLTQENVELKKEISKHKNTAKEGDYIMYNGSPYTPSDIERLLIGIRQLEELKTPTIENFADEEPADIVNHPSHYTGKYECIDVMQDVFGDEATDNFCLCNAFKYIWRARKKNGLEDVKKAVWYLNKYIEEAEKDGVRKGEQI